ncbi:MAG TPA: 4'-phosphopantetheinyl transferase superfamily protein [Bryobacteraceae bacterium]|nr:4'-phosphopantetheinyl transferase superfamily protein [Bryobacteraceae bacterium]
MNSAPDQLPRPGEIHIWDVPLDTGCPPVLSADEAQRASRIQFPEHRRRFAAGRTALRLILAHYTGGAADAIRFEYNGFGKPFLSGATAPRFNASHSGERALIAVANGREVGIDIERVKLTVDFRAITERFFPPEEAAQAGTAEDFFRVWTRREAYLKALGCGFAELQQPMRAGWTVQNLDAGEGWAAAVAAEGGGFTVSRWEFTT